jgi:PIN domain nuclease of toxin-antitoxin system
LRLLLDTHAALWWLAGERIGDDAARQLQDDTNQLVLSAVVVWEVALKRSLGKLRSPPDFAAQVLGAGAHALPVTIKHATAFETLPWHHHDPFDRMLVAQASVEGAAIVSRDDALRPYGVPVIW